MPNKPFILLSLALLSGAAHAEEKPLAEGYVIYCSGLAAAAATTVTLRELGYGAPEAIAYLKKQYGLDVYFLEETVSRFFKDEPVIKPGMAALKVTRECIKSVNAR